MNRQFSMQPLIRRPPRPNTRTRRGYTMLELCVAMMVFSVAISGLFPLVAVLSRHLQPLRLCDAQPQTATASWSPARDFETVRYTWAVTPYDDPWMRKLGAGARIASSTIAAVSPSPLQPPVRMQDDDNGFLDVDGDALDDYTGDTWTYNNAAAMAVGGDQHRGVALPFGSTSNGVSLWHITIATSGWYAIQVTWTASADQATDAQFTILRNGSAMTTPVTVNQQVAPVGVADADGHRWATLAGGAFTAGDVIQVQLSDVRAASTETGRYVVADAVRIVQNTVKVKSLERSPTGVNKNSNNADLTIKTSVTVHLNQ
ncbi:MAG: prepilin-type N-terminal cleavage/methylation domain-containing protein [Thermoguttaceae bacterium]